MTTEHDLNRFAKQPCNGWARRCQIDLWRQEQMITKPDMPPGATERPSDASNTPGLVPQAPPTRQTGAQGRSEGFDRWPQHRRPTPRRDVLVALAAVPVVGAYGWFVWWLTFGVTW